MNERDDQATSSTTVDEDMRASYKLAIEKAISHLPVKNGVINIDSIWAETSLPYDILNDILRQGDLILPDNVDRINIKSNVRVTEKPRVSRRRRRKKPKGKG